MLGESGDFQAHPVHTLTRPWDSVARPSEEYRSDQSVEDLVLTKEPFWTPVAAAAAACCGHSVLRLAQGVADEVEVGAQPEAERAGTPWAHLDVAEVCLKHVPILVLFAPLLDHMMK